MRKITLAEPAQACIPWLRTIVAGFAVRRRDKALRLKSRSPGAAVNARIVFCTCPDALTAARLARTLVDERLAACVNAIGGVASTYRWNGAVETADEVMLVIKTTADRFEAMQARLVAEHPYDVPEVIGLDVADGHAPYLAWLGRETRAE